MPELPEVETVVRTLRPHVVGKTIAAASVLRPDIIVPEGIDLASCLTSRIITQLERRGKRIVFALDCGSRFYVHLGMTGRLLLAKSSDALVRHTHLLIPIGRGFEIRFIDPRRFGGLWWLGVNHLDDNLGPEPLTLRAAELARCLAHTRRPIKSALLDQSIIAGLGNIYVDESLFTAQIHPLSIARDLKQPQLARLNRAIKFNLRRAIASGGSSLRDYVDANGNRGGYQELHRIYDRKGETCRVCKATIERIVLGGRSTHFCPHCQPKPRKISR